MSMTITMKRAVLAVLLALAAGLALSVAVAPDSAYAADKKPYTYTVRVWAGNEGTVNGESKYAVLDGIEYGTEMKLSDKFKVKVTNDKYYHKGFRLSGTDNQNYKTDGSSNLRDSIVVTEDMDYVVSYGVKGKMVEYTLHYVEYNNRSKVLAKSQTRIGRLGDKPVAAFEYISGYRPRYRNLTGTLKESGNDWYFEYIKLSTGETTSGTTTSTTSRVTTTTTTTSGGTSGGTTTGGTTTGGTSTGGTAASGTTTGTTTGSGAAASGNAEGGNAAGTQTPAPPQTEEIGDVDNPLADGTGSSSASSGSSAPTSSSSGTTGSSGSSAGSDNTGNTGTSGDTTSQSSASSDGPPYGIIFGIALVLVAIVGGVMYYLRTRRE